MRPALSWPAVAITLAPRWAASCTSRPPVTPPAPFTSTVSPAPTFSASLTTWLAVSAGTASAAATSNDTSGGSTPQCAAGTMNRSAQAPCSRSGAECAATRSPTANRPAEVPTAATTPAASTPRAMGGRVPTSQPPVRTNSSQLPTPHARTSSRISSARSARGSASSRNWIAPSMWRTPAARIVSPSRAQDPRVPWPVPCLCHPTVASIIFRAARPGHGAAGHRATPGRGHGLAEVEVRADLAGADRVKSGTKTCASGPMQAA